MRVEAELDMKVPHGRAVPIAIEYVCGTLGVVSTGAVSPSKVLDVR